ncbi:MAG TPA: 16S rRNA (cytosine(1402)-N(4))-methyltransferase RsmH [Candidatus Saccharimonadales bacterium]|nr:16S rRNA (cytosine(1402)-N(4))-methyltransferase RsmH [Candidatus Saccharimonadales bacterium]
MHQNQNKHQKFTRPSARLSFRQDGQARQPGRHTPVLLDEVLSYLDPQTGESYLDITAGYGGHARAILAKTKQPDQAVLVDRDQNAASELKKEFTGQGVNIRQADFLSASQELTADKREFDLILADLGVSSPHLNEASRGFAFAVSGPLDMRMDQAQALTAADIVNGYSQAQLAEILASYGQEPKAHQIANLIVGNRPLKTTTELAAIVAKAWPGHSRVHPATRTFQALRIAVNDELKLLNDSLPLWLELLKPGGRIAVISFHSLEDRLVKQFLAEKSGNRYDATLRLLSKRPITAGPHELVINPRARSAKLRAAVKIKTEREA